MLKLFARVKNLKSNTDGSTAAAFAIAMPVLIGALAISVEAGYFYKSKSDVQLYADMAAYAGALELQSAINPDAKTYAELDALNNGFDFDKGTITVRIPPTSGAFQGNTDAVEVIIEQSGVKFFSGVISDKQIQYRVRAVAANIKSGDPACIVALNETDASAFEVSGSTDLVLNGCQVHSNSVHSSGTKIGNRATLEADCVSAVGGIIGGGTFVCDAPVPGADHVPDPYASLPSPDISGLGCISPRVTATKTYLDPGLYCSSISIQDDWEMTGGGEYYFNNADLNFGRHGTLVGSDLTIILMNDSALNGLNGNATIQVSAQTSGPYSGVVVFSDPDTQPANDWTTINGNSSSHFEGLLYYPNQNLNWGGTTATSANCTLIVANKVVASGSADMVSSGCKSNFGIDPPTANGTNKVFIVE